MTRPPDLSPYPQCKPSGIPWLDDIPAHWQLPRLKYLCSRSGIYGANVPATEYQDTGIRFLRTTDITDEGHLKDGGVFLPKELVGDYLLDDGDVLISRSGTVGRSFLYQSKPLEEVLPIADFRTLGDRPPRRPNVCKKFGVSYMNTFKILRQRQVRFDWNASVI